MLSGAKDLAQDDSAFKLLSASKASIARSLVVCATRDDSRVVSQAFFPTPRRR
jgi:hypothetical protein